MFTEAVDEAIVVTAALALWLCTLTECAGSLLQLVRSAPQRPLVWTPKRAMLAGALVLGAGIMITRHFHQPETERNALPCGDGVDYDVRDGLCYKHVPREFQRHR